jgi:SPOR domain
VEIVSDDVSIPNSGYAGRRTGRYGRQNRAAGSDNRRLLIYAGGLGALLVAMVAASSLTSHRSGTVPVVEADPRPIRVKPDNPGGMQIDAAENDVFSGGSGTANAKLSAEAETPNPNGLQALPKPKPAALTAAAPATSVSPAASLPPAAAKSAVVAAEPPPAAKPAAATAQAATKPTVVASAVPAISPTAKAQPAHAATVQLAALTTEQAAKDEWQKLAHQLPEAFAGRQSSISKVEHDGRTFWRLRTAGFADVAQARAFCDKVRTKGGGCSVADF